MRFLLIAGLLVGLKNYQQNRVNQEHAGMDFAWKVDDLHTRDLLNYLVVSGEYDNVAFRKLDEKVGLDADFFDDMNKTKNIFLFSKNHPSIEDKKAAVEKLRAEAGQPILVHTDFEGGYVHNIDELSDEEIHQFGVPATLLKLRDEENKIHGTLSAFPSAGYLGEVYQKIVFEGDHAKRLAFIRMMEQYGKSIRKIMDYIGVDVVYGPNADIVDDFKANGEKNYIATDNRSFGKHFMVAQDLVTSFISGFQSSSTHILLVPKHFVGTGKSKDPHQGTDKSAMNKDDGSIAVFKNIINGNNPYLEKAYVKKCLSAADFCADDEDIVVYKAILEKNLAFIRYLERNGVRLVGADHVEGVMTTHLSGQENIVGSNEPITYSKRILDILKTKIGVSHPLSKGYVISDDLGMGGAKQSLEEMGIDGSEANRIITALSAGHDMVLVLETSAWKLGNDVDAVLDEVAEKIEKGVDLNNDGKADLSKKQLQEKVKKVLTLMIKRGELLQKGELYQMKDGTYFDPTIKKVLANAFLSNQGIVTGSGIEAHEKEGNSLIQTAQKKAKNVWESLAHNGPNAVYKYLTMKEEYESALQAGKKLIVVDKSEHRMFIFTVDGKKLLESYDIGLGKGTQEKDYTYDRKVFGDDKTPVGYYMIADKLMGEHQYEEFSRYDIDEKLYYGGPKGGMLKLIGPWTPYIALHGSQEHKTGPASNACVRVVDPRELAGKSDIKEQKLINHLAETIPVGSFVIITN